LFPHAASRNAKKPHAARAAFAQALYSFMVEISLDNLVICTINS
jgi:hypothetical protein